MNIYNLKKFSLIVLIIIIVVLIFLSLKSKEGITPTTSNETIVDNNKIHNLCYHRSNKTDREFYDVAWLKLNIEGNKITGDFYNLPAEKDSKIGKFEGTVGSVDQRTMSRIADVWWNSLAEGMRVTEELMINFGDGSASVGFGGEQKDRGDGVYIYTDKSKITYQLPMSQIDCESLDEKLFVEKYIRDNISSIATNSPVLGGNWYVISVSVNPSSHTGEVTYEDGHIQSKANIIYNYQKELGEISVTKFEVIK